MFVNRGACYKAAGGGGPCRGRNNETQNPTEATMGERVAHLVTGKMIDFMEFDDDFAFVKTRTPEEAVGKSLGESALRSKYGITIVGVKRPQTDFNYATPDTVVEMGDLLIVSGPTKLVQKFAAVT
jgi:trk system potassium uptake protein TrkA